MPIYEYQCTSCGNVTEKMQRMSAPPLTECEDCGGELKKLVSAPAFQFKGDGWYVTDYAKKDKEAKANKSKGSSEAKSDGKSESKSDSSKSDSGSDSSKKSESKSSSDKKSAA